MDPTVIDAPILSHPQRRPKSSATADLTHLLPVRATDSFCKMPGSGLRISVFAESMSKHTPNHSSAKTEFRTHRPLRLRIGA